MAGMLAKFVGGAAGAAGEQYGAINRDRLESVRQQRLMQMGLEAEESKYQKSQKRERSQLTDPDSNLSLRNKMELEQREKELQLAGKYSPKAGVGGAARQKDPKIHMMPQYDEDGIEIGKIPYVLQDGRFVPVPVGQKGGMLEEAGGGEVMGDPSAERMLSRRGGQGVSAEAEIDAIPERSKVIKKPVSDDLPGKVDRDKKIFQKVVDLIESPRTKITPGLARAQLNRLKNVGDVGHMNYRLQEIRKQLQAAAGTK